MWCVLAHLCPVMLAHRASIEVPVALELAWALWDDRERIPKWMPWIKSVKVRTRGGRGGRLVRLATWPSST